MTDVTKNIRDYVEIIPRIMEEYKDTRYNFIYNFSNLLYLLKHVETGLLVIFLLIG